MLNADELWMPVERLKLYFLPLFQCMYIYFLLCQVVVEAGGRNINKIVVLLSFFLDVRDVMSMHRTVRLVVHSSCVRSG